MMASAVLKWLKTTRKRIDSTKPIKVMHWNRNFPNDIHVAITALIGSYDKDKKDKKGGSNDSANDEDDE
eukprot:9472318-Ditylum_brightwellii.AAC.1